MLDAIFQHWTVQDPEQRPHAHAAARRNAGVALTCALVIGAMVALFPSTTCSAGSRAMAGQRRTRNSTPM